MYIFKDKNIQMKKVKFDERQYKQPLACMALEKTWWTE
jgi:hypothetical protein